ncbi:ABC transporter substrate-binding protein [Candidatus Uhrbacteria bacterium]|nr:ABC transporter substrate-binding protein [Candidatus Uhrbacteria bacterium]
MKRVNGWFGVAFLALILVGAGCAGQQPVSGRQEGTNAMIKKDTSPIVVGGIAPLTGEAAAYGVPDQNAKMLAVEEINAAGGINGRELKIVWEDGKCNGTDATTAVQKLLNVDKVKVILGGSCSGETLAAAQLTQSARALLFSGLSSSPDLTTAGDLVFRTYPSDAFAGKMVATYASKELGLKRAAIISENTDYAQALRRVFKEAFTEEGNEVVADEAFNTGETDFRTLVLKVKEQNPSVVYVAVQTLTPAEFILKQLGESGLKVQIIGSDSMLDRDFIKNHAELFEGIVSSELSLDESTSKTGGFVNAYTTKYAHAPEYPGYLAAAYDSVYLIAEAMKATGSTDPEAIATYFNDTVKDWQGALSTFNFDDNGDAVLNLNMRKIVGGEITDLGPYAIE